MERARVTLGQERSERQRLEGVLGEREQELRCVRLEGERQVLESKGEVGLLLLLLLLSRLGRR